MAVEFKTANGVEVVINDPDFLDAIALKNALGREFKKADIKLDIEQLRTNLDVDANVLISALLQIDTSEDVYKAVFKCLERSTYNKLKISPSTFQDPKAREDFYEIYVACIKETISPFLKGLVSRLSGIKSQILSNIQKSQ